jgi:hypothetical protein
MFRLIKYLNIYTWLNSTLSYMNNIRKIMLYDVVHNITNRIVWKLLSLRKTVQNEIQLITSSRSVLK